MILIDSVYINNGGGLVLLKYLVKVLTNLNIKVFYLFDERTEKYFKDLDAEKFFIPNKIALRKAFYLNNAYKFNSILCFGNVPPPIKLEIPVFVYFHQKLFVEIPKGFGLKQKVIYKIKQCVLKFYRKNASLWLVQSQLMQIDLARKYFNGNISKIKILPFYAPLDLSQASIVRKKDSFLYVSNASQHKNHINLIDAFCNAYDSTKKGTLSLTVPESAIDICLLIKEKISKGYPINNVGFVNRSELGLIYLAHEYLIFPSLSESFGLGLVEAIDAECKVIAADLPYTYQVCNPSLTFNPYTVESIEGAIIKAMTENLPSSNKIISNDIKQLISILSE